MSELEKKAAEKLADEALDDVAGGRDLSRTFPSKQVLVPPDELLAKLTPSSSESSREKAKINMLDALKKETLK